MRVRVEPKRCQGHTLCSMIAPESFELDDVDGHASAVTEEVPVEHQDQVREAARSCPEQAIIITSDWEPASSQNTHQGNGAAV